MAQKPIGGLGCFVVLGLAVVSSVLAKGTPPASKNASSLQPLRNWDLKFTHISLDQLDSNYFAQGVCKLDDPNTFSYSIQIIRDFPPDVKSVFYTYEKNSRNEYVPSLTVKGTVCDDFQKELRNMPLFRCLHFKSGGFKECPFKVGQYNATKVRCTSADGPPVAPGHYWHIKNVWTTADNVVIGVRTIDLVVERKAKFPISV